MKKEQLLDLALKIAGDKISIYDVSVKELVQGKTETNDVHIYFELTCNPKLEEEFAESLAKEIYDVLGYETYFKTESLNDRYLLDVRAMKFDPLHGHSEWKGHIHATFGKHLPKNTGPLKSLSKFRTAAKQWANQAN